MPTYTVEDYQIGWICALPEERAAAMAMLTEEHPKIAQVRQDDNNYELGSIHEHKVVIASTPLGADGPAPAAAVARDMVRSFPELRFVLMVGIGGGIPDLRNHVDIRLGDIVVSKPGQGTGGVVQWDNAKVLTSGKFEHRGHLNQPPNVLLSALASLQSRHEMLPSNVPTHIAQALKRFPKMKETGYSFPATADRLYCSTCNKNIERSGTSCQNHLHYKREPRKDNNPVVHYGIIASGNKVVDSAKLRDQLRDGFGACCVEMEAAGLMNNFPCLVIRGICDYADCHKDDTWHGYAALVAAAYAKELLECVSHAQTDQQKPIKDVLGELQT